MDLIVEFSRGHLEEKTQISYQLYQFGRDWILMIGGGERHFGSLACSDPSLEKRFHQYTLGIHKEGEIVRAAIEELQPLIRNELIVICGVHYDDISKDQIVQIVDYNQQLRTEIKGFFQSLDESLR